MNRKDEAPCDQGATATGDPTSAAVVAEPGAPSAGAVPLWPQLPAAGDVAPGAGAALFDLHALVYRLFHAQRRYLFRNDRVSLGVGQPKVLSYLAVYGTSTQSQLAQYFDLDPAAISRMIDALKRGGYIEAAPHATDRRAKAVELTDFGKQTVAAWDVLCAELAETMLAGFSPAERGQFADLLARSYANLKELESDKDGKGDKGAAALAAQGPSAGTAVSAPADVSAAPGEGGER